jgi:O-antigen ligase
LLFIFFILFFSWQLIGIIYSENRTEGWGNIIIRLSLFLFPLVLVSPGEMIQRKVKALLRIFAISTFVYIIFCFGYAFYRSIHIQNGIWTFNSLYSPNDGLNYFFGSDFAVFQHPSYLSIYILFSVFIAFESCFDYSIRKMQKVVWLVISLILLTSIYFLSSRAGMLSVFILVPFYFLLRVRKIREYPFAWIFILLMIAILIPVVLITQRTSNHNKGFFKKSLTETARQDGRLIIWKAALEISRKNLIFGVGTGAATDALVAEYERLGKEKMADVRLNAHNQFLEIILENGIISLILFLSIFATMFYIAIKENKIIYLVFILMLLLFFLFESILNRLGGVSFFALFAFLLMHLKTNRGKVS